MNFYFNNRNKIVLQYKTVLTPPADYLESLANMNNSNGTDAGNMTAGKPSMKKEMRKKHNNN